MAIYNKAQPGKSVDSQATSLTGITPEK